jgi:7-keto-8-aminopelargonate synthetase-like enzyme
MVDEAHATGLFGETGSGLIEELALVGRVEIQMATLGKALGAAGGCICGSRQLVDFLINRARPFIFSTAPVPAGAAAAAEAVRLVQSPEGTELRQKLRSNIGDFQSAMRKRESLASDPATAIIPIILGDEEKALNAAARLRAQNIFVPAIRFPSVARGSARLRVTLTAAHSREDIFCLVDALKKLDIGI